MDFSKPGPESAPHTGPIHIECVWDRTATPARRTIAALSTGEPDLDYLHIDRDGKIRCLNRAQVLALTYAGDQRSGHGQNDPDETFKVCGPYPCQVHDHRESPAAPQQKTTMVMPLWDMPRQ